MTIILAEITALFLFAAILVAVTLSTRKELRIMSLALDALTVQVTGVETAASAIVSDVAALKTQVATLQASGEDPVALAALTARLKVVQDALTAASALPAAAPSA